MAKVIHKQMDRKSIRVLRGRRKPVDKQLINKRIAKIIMRMSYNDMIEASLLAERYVRKINIKESSSTSPYVNLFLAAIKKQNEADERLALRTLNYLNQQIVKRNERESRTSIETAISYKRMMNADD